MYRVWLGIFSFAVDFISLRDLYFIYRVKFLRKSYFEFTLKPIFENFRSALKKSYKVSNYVISEPL